MMLCTSTFTPPNCAAILPQKFSAATTFSLEVPPPALLATSEPLLSQPVVNAAASTRIAAAPIRGRVRQRAYLVERELSPELDRLSTSGQTYHKTESCSQSPDGRSSALRSSLAPIPSTRTTFSRAPAPRTTETLRTPPRARLAIRRHSASFARPCTGGAVTRTTTTPSRSPTISFALARGCRRTAISHPSITGPCSTAPWSLRQIPRRSEEHTSEL